jgi:putative DNA primase/helicase
LYQVVRYEPKDFKQRQPNGHGGFIWNLIGVPLVLYHYPEVREAIALEKTICIAEGEADVEALRRRGYVATCNSGGALKWTASHASDLQGAADVVIFGDHDEKGRDHVAQVEQSLRAMGIMSRIAELDGLPEHGDVRDWLTSHNQEDLDRIVAQAVPAQPAKEPRPFIVHAHEVQQQPIQWIWAPYIPRSMPVMLDGDPGLGKTLMLLQVAANLSKGLPFLDQVGKPTLAADVDGPQTTLILSAEDSLPHIMIPRLNRAGADLTRIKFLQGWLGPEDEEHAFDLQHLWVLTKAIEQWNPVLVILDPLVAYLGDIDMHRANETRPVMAALKTVAERYGCTIMGVRHPSKMDQGGPLMYRGQGNVDLIGAARSGLWVQQHPAHAETQSLLIHTKTNVGRLGRTVVFSREGGEFAWRGVSRLRESMLTGKGPDPVALLEAFFWLEETMKPGIPYDSSKIEKEAGELEISRNTLNRAKKVLGVLSRKDGEMWRWILPPLSTTTTVT